MSISRRPRPVVLCILDGWGHRDEPADDNAILKARTPNLDRLARTCPVGFIDASEGHVGLPRGQMGNSEVGHMNIGAGRIAVPELPRIDQAIEDGSFARLPKLQEVLGRIKAAGGACHILGLMSDGGVHSHQDHMAALARAASAAGLRTWIHAITDGRDTPPQSARGFIEKFSADLAGLTEVKLATVSGRFYAMDRDKRWERLQRAFEAVVLAQGERAAAAGAAVDAAYARGETDEFILPTVLEGYGGMADGDGLIMANFRADRAREILAALLDPGFDDFPRRRVPAFSAAAGMAAYSRELDRFLVTLFAPVRYQDTLGEMVAKAGLTQLRIAETEKYAHVTFFFNGGEEREFPGETRILVPSPKVRTYDLKPEMSAPEVTEKLVDAIEAGRFDFIVVNYANTDMVGHTGNIEAATRAVEAVDACLGKLSGAVMEAGGAMLVTADHGNAEQMRDPATGAPHTAHTTNRVPAMLIGGPAGIGALADGKLADIAPTMLDLLGLPQPRSMTGRSLLQPVAQRAAASTGRRGAD
ncbi:MAG: 2,3-bisphosphoglycerate-independent phosphoglycerate mutase [Alphaproteobacteria bacterium]|nr:2,3-bisphosphoglycerate-independent phosphoglycerate mutase [Alphaproteobacteria bacterium]